MARINYNERSWAIDVISEINLFLANKSWHFKSAGGENTISNDKFSLFPDVLIFRDISKEIVLQGWELKMPDTAINDAELIKNAIKKAKILQRQNFILWNVKSAVLYAKSGESYVIVKAWHDIDINSRAEVKLKENLWKALLFNILEYLNSYFVSGEISDDIIYEIFSIDKIIDIVLENVPPTTENLKSEIRGNSRLEAQINGWWLSSATEYGYKPASLKDKAQKLPTLSRVILTDWIFKIVFANILKRYFNEARAIERINYETTITTAKQIIGEISRRCNFWNIFSDNLALEYIPTNAWKQIVQLNQFLAAINIQGLEIEILHDLLQSSITAAKRKVAGQFATPKKLADLLVRLTIDDKNGRVIDPCCGTGTIIKQAYLLKEEYHIPQHEIINSIWASDKHSFPIQLSTMSLTMPDNIGQVLNIFKSDVISLHTDQSILFKNPNDGSDIQKQLPCFNYVVSNLPFVKSKEIEVLNPGIISINEFIHDKSNTRISLSGKSDIFAYIPFYLNPLLESEGKIGIILSNAWMGTDYGEIFIKLFQKFFDIEIVVISGKGKWFQNAKVVTTILIAQKRDPLKPIDANKVISFCTLLEKIENIDDIQHLTENIILKKNNWPLIVQNYSVNQIEQLEHAGIPWCGYFAKIEWLPLISNKLTDCKEVFDFTRGERRGWNKLFYPAKGHNIEKEYIKPILKNLKGALSFACTTNKEAFCCSRSIEELQSLNHTGALGWIRSFENQNNESGVPLTQSLHKANQYWYEMSVDNMADFVANVNYDKSLFIAAFETRSFIDQRMIGFSIKTAYKSENKILFLALFNSIVCMFFIESFGFGRGDGALDLRATKVERDFKILNPNLLLQQQKQSIINAFEPITKRNRLPLEQELLQADRIHFEQVLFDAYGITEYYDAIKESLMHLYRIRFAVKN
jgi:hypothetical protein